MAVASLSANDINVLEKIKAPECDPLRRVVIDPSLPQDAIHSEHDNQVLNQQERNIIVSLPQFDGQPDQEQPVASRSEREQAFRNAVTRFGTIIYKFPTYASARNNRAQALRRLYGDDMLMLRPPSSHQTFALVNSPELDDRRQAAFMCLQDLDACVSLLTPASPRTPVSQKTARTLAAAHTQRAALYHRTARALAHNGGILDMDSGRPESTWDRISFEEAAAHDFAQGGWYGNEIAKVLAVSVNPTAKLCGEIVREAMKREYGDMNRI